MPIRTILTFAFDAVIGVTGIGEAKLSDARVGRDSIEFLAQNASEPSK